MAAIAQRVRRLELASTHRQGKRRAFIVHARGHGYDEVSALLQASGVEGASTPTIIFNAGVGQPRKEPWGELEGAWA